MNLVITLIIWSALLTGITAGLKTIARAVGIREHVVFVRLLPVLPFVFGALTGVWVLPAAARAAKLAEVAGLPWHVHLLLGFGAGAVAGQCWKIVTQSLKGADLRITAGGKK